MLQTATISSEAEEEPDVKEQTLQLKAGDQQQSKERSAQGA